MPQDPPRNTLVVNADGTLSSYDQGAQNWGNHGFWQGWALKMLAFRTAGAVYQLGTEGNVRTTGETTDFTGNLGGWTLDWIAFQPGGELWGVGTEGNVGTYHGSWQDYGVWGGWTLRMIAFDTGGGMWGVGTDGNLGSWNFDERSWKDVTAEFGGWTLKMVAFHGDGSMWCVGSDGNIGKLEGGRWTDYGLVAGRQVKSICFDPAGTA